MFPPFSFQFNLPGIRNPFTRAPAATNSAQSSSASPGSAAQPHGASINPQSALRPLHPKRPHPRDLSPSQPTRRKRGWSPSLAEPSSTVLTSSGATGWVDSPAKYRDMAANRNDNHEGEHMLGDLPAAKKRRTLAGSIVSTAMSAALIGTAVGLTVYRLWRDRGKEPEALPPPPYQQGDWIPAEAPPEPPTTTVTPPTPKRKPKQALTVGRHATSSRHRKSRSKVHAMPFTPPRSSSPSKTQFQTRHEIEPAPAGEDPSELEDQMDWMGGKLAQLIAEGQKALGREVVVMSEAPEDEVDDATGDWQEEDNAMVTDTPGRSTASSRRGSVRRRHAPSLYSGTPSPRKSRFDGVDVPQSSREKSVELFSAAANPNSSASMRENEHEWQSAEMREFMERARAAKASRR
ncbi:hypothetical protein PUNSTDRAFT_142996 [Punctularia strigosozonata HHB-11173 SS5]|uniref:uncharacterized protein n=1 Tax=Punctularia strigosozonata (strain HHB-11173) TaxID=741275 RepID=UPI000441630F|nr:uncharacterized protein PUNSTDRAFT_142996 [Punctularia strigosozonata HHB-11173 SS5]EIN09434.1 hypothetical protein PUNSTDRAFT_142996 [Punctularia strigosozonata HHB-11173 SS5]